MLSLAKILGPRAEIITEFKHESLHKTGADKDTEKAIMALLGRRPCTGEDVANALSLHQIEAVKLLADLVENGYIELHKQSENNFYVLRK